MGVDPRLRYGFCIILYNGDMKIFGACMFVVFLAGTAGGDAVIMRDGSVRYGTMISHSASEVQFRTQRDGISLVVVIPVPQIARIIVGAEAPAPAGQLAVVGGSTAGPASPASLPGPVAPPRPLGGAGAESAPGGAVVPSASEAELAAFASRGFIWELMAGSVGQGPDDVNRLPAADRELWEQAVKAEAGGKRAETLEALRALEAAMHDLPAGQARLEAIARRERQEGFGVWMARVHWELIGGKYSTGQFDFNDVREAERRGLIGLLRKATGEALEPLKPYFPPVDEKTGVPGAFKVAQLQGITAGNALEVKDKALFAAAVLLGQLKLEPEMPGVDRALLYGQLTDVNRVLGRARDLEPLAKAALVRAEQEKKAAEEKARREALIAGQRAATKPK